MLRPPRPLTRGEIALADLDIFDQVVERPGANPEAGDGELSCYWRTLLYWPEYAANRVGLSSVVRTAGDRAGGFSHAQREFVDQVLMAHMKSNAVAGLHLPDALAAGVRLEAIEALRAGRAEDLTEEEGALAQFVRAVADGTVKDSIWGSVESRLGTRGTVQLAIFVTVVQATIRQIQAFGCPDPTDSQFEAMLEEFRAGRREVPSDWRSRIR
jgi:hypothetical protein